MRYTIERKGSRFVLYQLMGNKRKVVGRYKTERQAENVMMSRLFR